MTAAMQSPTELEAAADRAAGAGRFREALDLLEKAVAGGDATPDAWKKVSAMRKASGNLSGALEAIDLALAFDPTDFTALFSRAIILDQSGSAQAGREFGNALAVLPPDQDPPAALAAAIEHARGKWKQHQEAFERRLNASVPKGLEPFQRERVERFITNRSRRTRPFHQEPTDFAYPGMPEFEFHDRAAFPELDQLEARTDAIRAEFEALTAAEFAEIVPYTQYPDRVPLRQWQELNNNPKWSAIHLLQNGRRIDANARHCPVTMEAIAALGQPDIPGACPNAMFSLLAPATRIPAHTGVANIRLVCHLPLIVPPDCGFRVGETVRQWVPGEAFVFDDTIEHEAWNDSDRLRVVLIVDLWPPALGQAEREAVASVIGASGVSFSGA